MWSPNQDIGLVEDLVCFYQPLPGLIILALEGINSYFKGLSRKHIFLAGTAMRQDHMSVKNRFQQYSNVSSCRGKHNVETLDKVIDTINSLHHHQTELESVYQSTE